MLVHTAGATVERIDLVPAYEQFNNQDFGFRVPELFPPQVVSADAGSFGTIGAKEHLQRIDTRQAAGAPAAEVNHGISSDSFQIYQYSVKQFCDDQMQDRYGGWYNQQRFATMQCRGVVDRDMEYRGARLIQDTGSFPNTSGVAQWDNASSADPMKDVSLAIEAFRKRYGVKPNTGIIGTKLKSQLCRTNQIRASFLQGFNNGGQVPSNIKNEILAELLDLGRIVDCGAVYDTANPGQALSAEYIWNQTMFVLAYVAAGGTMSGMPVMGEQLVRNQGGGAGVAITSTRQFDPEGDWVKAKTRHQLKMNPNAPVYIITGLAS